VWWRNGGKEMNMLIKAGLIFLIVGGLSFLGLIFVVLGFGIGGSGNPPLTGWLAVLITFITTIGFFWFVFLIIGAVLTVAGFLKKRNSM
jgi:hypothetical protein